MEIVEIKVERLFLVEFRKCVAYAFSEFGRKTVKNWNAEYEKIRNRLEIMPTGYPFVPELQKWQKYRGAIITKNLKTKIQIIIDTPKILRRKKYTGAFFIQLNPHNPLNFSVLCNFIAFFLRIPIFLRIFAPISNVEL